MSIFRWWARRTSAVTGAVLDAYAKVHPGDLVVCDPFAGGGTVALECIRRGYTVHAQDIDPWAALGIAVSLRIPDAVILEEAGNHLYEALKTQLVAGYATQFANGEPAEIAHTLRVAVGKCPTCAKSAKLFPYATLTYTRRGTSPGFSPSWRACVKGHIHLANELRRSVCPECGVHVDPTAVYTSARVIKCSRCAREHRLSTWAGDSGFRWEIVLVERADGRRREFSRPTDEEIQQSEKSYEPGRSLGPIEEGRETRVLLRHGFSTWDQLYPPRQRALLNAALDAVPTVASGNEELERALRIAVVGAAEMAGYMSRWDRRYLKSYEMMAAHRFNLTTFTAEPHVWGIGRRCRNAISRRLAAFSRAARWYSNQDLSVPVEGPFEEAARRTPTAGARIVCGSSDTMPLPSASVDLVWTDPPYHDDIAYHDLSSPLRAWASLGDVDRVASAGAIGDDLGFKEVLRSVFSECRRVLRPDGRMMLTFANRAPGAWIALFRALREGGFFAYGYSIVRSDGDADYAKIGRRSSRFDIVLELGRRPLPAAIKAHGLTVAPRERERRCLYNIGEIFLSALSHSRSENWVDQIHRVIKATYW